MRHLLILASVLALAAPRSPAQSPQFYQNPAAPLGGQVLVSLVGDPNAAFATFLDLDGTQQQIRGLKLFLGLTPQLALLDSGSLNSLGLRSVQVSIPDDPALDGLAVFGQSIVLPAGSTQPLASNGASTIILKTVPGAPPLIESFLDARASGFTGSYDQNVKERLQGAAVQRRTHASVDPQGTPFLSPLYGALTPFGSRQQLVFRPLDVGATGEEEVLVAIRWKPFGGSVTPDRFANLTIEAGHSHIFPNYTIHPISLLPVAPNSGLFDTFALNYKPGDPTGIVTLASGAYAIDPANLRSDGYLDFALSGPFPYNGQDSLLLDFKMVPDLSAGGTNGQTVNLMVNSSPRPNARMTISGNNPGQLVDPTVVTRGRMGDNALPDYQFEFARVKSTAVSPFLRGLTMALDYGDPLLAASIPPGTSIQLEYRGSADISGSNVTAWSASVDVADGFAYIQYRVTFTADHLGEAVPSIDTLVIPMR